MRARLPMLSLALLASLALAACGQEAQDEGGFQTESAQVAETEAIYMTVDGMKYQVQISRQLNPLTIDDRDYLAGLPEDDRALGEDEEWFGIWMRVENHHEREGGARQMVRDFEIHDTQDNVYRPIEFGPGNPFAYRPGTVQGGELYPDPNSPAGERQPYASLILFKVRRFSLDNRPLELFLEGPESGEKAQVALDV